MATFGDVDFPSDSSDDEEYHPTLQPVQVKHSNRVHTYITVYILSG